MVVESESSHAEGDVLGAELERLRVEVEEVRASRARLIHAADSDRRRLERELHGGLQQRLVALAIELQLAQSLVQQDPPATMSLLEGMRRDVEALPRHDQGPGR